MIGIVMLHFGKLKTTKLSLSELFKDNDPILKLYLINNTQDDLSSITKQYPQIVVINNKQNLGFAKGVNQGIKRALKDGAGSVVLLNNDLLLSSKAVKRLSIEQNRDPQIGVISPVLEHALGYDWGGKFSPWTGLVKHQNFPNAPKTTLTVEHTAAAAIMIKKTVFDQVGYFDERFFLYYEDLDFCLRVKKAGFKISITPFVLAKHQTSAGTNSSRRTLYQWRSHVQFVSKHLFKLVYPTAYLIDLFIYPLFYLKSLFKKS